MIFGVCGHPLVTWHSMASRYVVAMKGDDAECRVCNLLEREQHSAQKNHPGNTQADRVSMRNAWIGRDTEGNSWSALSGMGSHLAVGAVAALERSMRTCARFESVEESAYRHWCGSKQSVMFTRERNCTYHPDTGEPRAEYLATRLLRGESHATSAYFGTDGARKRIEDYQNDGARRDLVTLANALDLSKLEAAE